MYLWKHNMKMANEGEKMFLQFANIVFTQPLLNIEQFLVYTTIRIKNNNLLSKSSGQNVCIIVFITIL